MTQALQELLLKGAEEMGIPMTPSQADQMAQYHGMLTEANRKMNLTRVSEDAEESVKRNYLDSIAVLAGDVPHEGRVIDVGSGAGLPGLPLAIMLPDVHFTLLDSMEKRTRFLQSVVDALSLSVTVVHARAEEAAAEPLHREQYDLAIARGVARLNVLCEYLLPFVRKGGSMIALKGPAAEEELTEAAHAIRVLGGGKAQISPLVIPGTDWDHRGVWIRKTKETPREYPRTPAAMKKHPL
ncbi:MAG: 16S rRNA (guanine(527)-N(7))-methyltransferase RsmG [Lachnospiraceae bacterium]|nr:16S rRNA (guanine(527)-N(7))-methyltransferase RsmG [Lachnospiraceae bacterium]